jgi:hypothetical protein
VLLYNIERSNPHALLELLPNGSELLFANCVSRELNHELVENGFVGHHGVELHVKNIVGALDEVVG